MPGIIDPQTMYVDDLPTIWAPVQTELSEAEHHMELEEQATASLLWAADVPEAVLRLLTGETEIDRVFDPPDGYDPEQQGEWNNELLTFAFKKPIKLVLQQQQNDLLEIEYRLESAGYWRLEITPQKITIERV